MKKGGRRKFSCFKNPENFSSEIKPPSHIHSHERENAVHLHASSNVLVPLAPYSVE
jgi:hypothetical protein